MFLDSIVKSESVSNLAVDSFSQDKEATLLRRNYTYSAAEQKIELDNTGPANGAERRGHHIDILF